MKDQVERDRIRSLLIKMAAEMARGQNMPFEFIEDWNLPVSTSRKTKRRLIEQGRVARKQCLEWATTLRKLYDILAYGLSE